MTRTREFLTTGLEHQSALRAPRGDRPKALVLGGCDVHKRIDLMQHLSGEFDVAAAGSSVEAEGEFSATGFPYFRYSLDRGASPLADLNSLMRLRHLIETWRPDVVHTFATKPSVWGRIAARWAGVPVILGTLPGLGSLYASDGYCRDIVRAMYEPLQKLACRVSDRTIFYNESDAKRFIGAGIVPAQKSVVMPGSGVRTDLYDPSRVHTSAIERLRGELGASNGTLVVTMIARVIRSKGVLEFAQAARLLRSRYDGKVRFLLVGPNDRDSMDKLSRAELDKLSDSVIWLGERREIREILAGSDVFVLPSYYGEGIPRVLIEAASMALPLVATRTPGCKDVVEDGHNGLLVPPTDSAALARAIETLVEQRALRWRLATASRKLAVKKFDVLVVARQTASLYRHLLRQKGLLPELAVSNRRRSISRRVHDGLATAE